MRALLALLLLTSVAQAGRNELSIGSHVTLITSDVQLPSGSKAWRISAVATSDLPETFVAGAGLLVT